MIKLVTTITSVVGTPGAEVTAPPSGPALVSRSSTYRGARRPAPVLRMLSLRLTVPPAEEDVVPEPSEQSSPLPVLFL